MSQDRRKGKGSRSGGGTGGRFRDGSDRGSRGGFRSGSGGGFGGGFNSRPPRTMHKATCADCGKECEVPFEPTEGRPVYCRDCFAKHKPKRF